jgi:selenocysteine-specific elongation factor
VVPDPSAIEKIAHWKIKNRMTSLIVGTAGHIDHGKSALVRALTGTDPDRLPEEKKRGITIDLGFADLTLGDLRIGFVDVPGHERFVRNMLAGAHGIDLLALVIAADEGVMPQTREHFEICRLLGVGKGLVVLTKADLVDAEMLQLVEEEAKQLVAGSFLEDSPIVAVSSRTGFGLDKFKSELTRLAHDLAPRSKDLVTRLPIDRAFSMKGFGAVITGTLTSGQIREGVELELLPRGQNVRVRGVQVHGQSVVEAHAGQRTALNLAGVDVDQLERGLVLAPIRRLRPTQIMDVKLEVLPGVSKGVRSRSRVRVHLGTTEVTGRVRVLDPLSEVAPGKSGMVQFRFDTPIVALQGDRFIVRSHSPAETIAGGIVIDPLASKHRGKALAKTLLHLRQMLEPDRASRFSALVQSRGEKGMGVAELAAATGWIDEVIQHTVKEGLSGGAVVELGGIFFSKSDADRLTQKLLSELDLHHRNEPLARGMSRETLREKVFTHGLPETFAALIAKLEASRVLVAEKEIIRLQSHKVDLSEKDLELQRTFEQLYLKAGVEVPSVDELMSQAGVSAVQRVQGRKILQLLIDTRKIVRLQGEMFMHAGVVESLKSKLLEYASNHEPDRLIDVSAFKDLAGVSRKYAIPLLEYFDRTQVTRRAGDKRVVLKPR